MNFIPAVYIQQQQGLHSIHNADLFQSSPTMGKPTVNSRFQVVDCNTESLSVSLDSAVRIRFLFAYCRLAHLLNNYVHLC